MSVVMEINKILYKCKKEGQKRGISLKLLQFHHKNTIWFIVIKRLFYAILAYYTFIT